MTESPPAGCLVALLSALRPKKPTPPVDPPPVDPPPTNRLTFPSGAIKTRAPGGSDRWQDVSWTQVSRWEPLYTQAGNEFGIAPLLLAAFSLVETNAQHYKHGQTTGRKEDVIFRKSDAYDTVPAVGMMQIKLGYHAKALPDADGYTPLGNLRLAAKLLAGWIKQYGSWEAALTKAYHPGDDPQSGVTQQEYIRAIRDIIAEVKASWPQTPGTPAPQPGKVNPFRKPVIYDLAKDYAKYGITSAEAQKIITNRFENRQGGSPKYIVNHIQDGNTPGSLQWWARGAGVQASSTVMIQRDGSILRIVPEQHGPWTNGDTCNPTPKAKGLLALGGNPNIWSLTIESEGKPGVSSVSYTPEQLESICWQDADWMIRYNLPLANVLSHAAINQCSRPTCPGEANQLAVLEKLKKAGFA